MSRSLVLACTLLLGALLPAAPLFADATHIKVYKSPTCSCCSRWADQLSASGFDVETVNVPDMAPIKQQFRVPRQLGSCHTAIVDGYVIEGHVPIADILRLLRERPDKKGIGVPGMPIGSPGMEGPDPQPFKVYAFDAQGSIEEFASHSP